MQLDLDTGGGIPAGSAALITGKEGAGKTTLLYMYYAMQQRIFGEDTRILHAIGESYPDFFHMRKCGVKIAIPEMAIKHMQKEMDELGLPPLTKEELKDLQTTVGTVDIISTDNAEDLFDSLLDAIRSNYYRIIGIDSLSVLTPKEDLAKDMEDKDKIGSRAMLKRRFLDRYHSIVRKLDTPNYTTLLAIGQVRADKDAGLYGRDYKSAEGYSFNHASTSTIMLESGKKIKKTVNKVLTVVGKEFKWELIKGKSGSHEALRGSVPFMFGKPFDNMPPIDRIESLIAPGVMSGVIQVTDNGVLLVNINGEPIRDPFKNEKEMMEAIRNDWKLELVVRKNISFAKGVPSLYVES